MKTIKITMDDPIYDRLLTAGTQSYQKNVTNPDYDPEEEGSQPTISNPKTKDQYLIEVVDQSIKNILSTYEVQDVSNKAVAKKQKEIQALTINTTIT